MKNLFYVVIISLLLFSCEKETAADYEKAECITNTSTTTKLLQGTWQLIISGANAPLNGGNSINFTNGNCTIYQYGDYVDQGQYYFDQCGTNIYATNTSLQAGLFIFRNQAASEFVGTVNINGTWHDCTLKK